MVLSGVPQKKSPVTPPGIDPGTFQLVAQCLNHYANPVVNVALFNSYVFRVEYWATALNCMCVTRNEGMHYPYREGYVLLFIVNLLRAPPGQLDRHSGILNINFH